MSEPFADESASPRWRNSLAWLILMGLGFLVLELTAQPGLAAVIVCAKFGWNDFRTALWLRRRDPDYGRGRTCFWFYIASSLWKTALTAFVLMVAIAVFEANQNQLPAHIPGLIVTALISFTLSVLTTYVAISSALLYRVRVWLDFTVHFARKSDVWPPTCWGTNNAPLLILIALIPPVTVFFLSISLVAGLVIAPVDPNAAAVILMIGSLVGGAAAILLLRDKIVRHILARSPWECWGIAESDETY